MGVTDKFPQPLKFQVAGPNATDDLNNRVDFPEIIQEGTNPNFRIATEIVKIRYDFSPSVLANLVSGGGLRIAVHYQNNLTAAQNDQDTATATLGDEALLDTFSITRNDFGTAGNAQISILPWEHDLSGPDGRGILFPGTFLFISLSTDVDTSGDTIGVSIVYRQHRVALVEFLGMIASRQQQ